MAADFGPCGGGCGGRLTMPSEKVSGLCIYCREDYFGQIYPEFMMPLWEANFRRLMAEYRAQPSKPEET